MKRTKRWWIVGAIGGVAAIGVYFVFDPAAGVWFPKCPFLLATGWQCPGCGSQRAVHALLHGDWAQAVHSNVLFVVSLPYLLGMLWRPHSPRGERVRRFFYGAPALWTVFGFIVLFWVIRNL